jgi:hypothetical protein
MVFNLLLHLWRIIIFHSFAIKKWGFKISLPCPYSQASGLESVFFYGDFNRMKSIVNRHKLKSPSHISHAIQPPGAEIKIPAKMAGEKRE